MQDLEILKKLQITYQEKFAIFLKLQEGDTVNSPEYNAAKQDWIKAGQDVKEYLEKAK